MKKKRGGQKKRRGMCLLLILSMIVLALSGCSKKKETKTEKPPTKKIEVEKPEPVEEVPEEPEEEKIPENQNLLTGLADLTDAAIGKRPVAVMVNNIPAAMPQYGVEKADIIFEIPVEGDQTRFMALYADYTTVPQICAIRSCRYYFPALIAVTVSMTIFPLSTGLMVSLDPFCPLENIDIEFMDRKPNFWALIPLYCEMLMSSERIPEDYDMSHLRTIGAGAEAMNDRKYAEVEEFFHKHNVQAKLSAGYGQSEGCSNLTLPNPMFPLEDGCVGMPMTATVLGVFDKDLNELNYGESGELCMTGPSMMLHYSGWRGEELTEQTLVEHPDGNTWLHTGDEAYITEQGIVHILGRGEIKAYGDKPLHVMRMETKTVRTPGVKDGFFCLVPDQEHEGYYRPYLFVILDGTKTLEEVAELLKDTLEEHEYPVEIREITERPYFHFKTDRKGLTARILKELEQAKEEK